MIRHAVPVATIVIVGDIGGQRQVLEKVITELGGDPVTGHLPADLTVVQVGDLVRMQDCPHLDSDGCVAIADRMLHGGPGRWIQLLGNHDTAAIGGPRMPAWGTANPVSPTTLATLNRWWHDREADLAVAMTGQDRDSLITHAGLTRAR